MRLLDILRPAFCAVVLGWALAASAQSDALQACEDACYDAEGICVDVCDERSDTIACRADCVERANACLDACE